MEKPYILRKLNNGAIIIYKDGSILSVYPSTCVYEILPNKNKPLIGIKNVSSKNFSMHTIPVDKLHSIESVNKYNVITSKTDITSASLTPALDMIFSNNTKQREIFSDTSKHIYNIQNTQRRVSNNTRYPDTIIDVETGKLKFNIEDSAQISIEQSVLFRDSDGFIKYTTLETLSETIASKGANFFIVKTLNDRNSIEFDPLTIHERVGMIVFVQANKKYYKLIQDENNNYCWARFDVCNWAIGLGSGGDICSHYMFWDLGETPYVDESLVPNSANIMWDLGVTPDIDESTLGDNCQEWEN